MLVLVQSLVLTCSESHISDKMLAASSSSFRQFAPPVNFAEVGECDFAAFGAFHRRALNHGIYFPPSQYEAVFLTGTMTQADIDHLVNGVVLALNE